MTLGVRRRISGFLQAKSRNQVNYLLMNYRDYFRFDEANSKTNCITSIRVRLRQFSKHAKSFSLGIVKSYKLFLLFSRFFLFLVVLSIPYQQLIRKSYRTFICRDNVQTQVTHFVSLGTAKNLFTSLSIALAKWRPIYRVCEKPWAYLAPEQVFQTSPTNSRTVRNKPLPFLFWKPWPQYKKPTVSKLLAVLCLTKMRLWCSENNDCNFATRSIVIWIRP